MSVPPYQPDTPAPSGHHDPDLPIHLTAPPYPLNHQPPGGPTFLSNATDHQTTHQPASSGQNVISGGTRVHNQHGGNRHTSANFDQLDRTYNFSSSGYHSQGQVTNSLNIDPALSPWRHDGRQQTPLHQFNMHPGSHVTFAGNSFQQSNITQGNQNLRVQGIEPLANDSDQKNEDNKRFEDFLNNSGDDDTFLSKHYHETTMPADGLGSFHNKSMGTMGPPPLPIKAVARNTGRNNFFVYTQRSSVNPASSPHASSPELMNSNDDQSVGGASATQESSGDAHNSLSSTSQVKKRRRASSGDGSSGVSVEDGGESRKPQNSTTQRKRTRKSKSNTPVSSIKSSLSRRESLLAADYSEVQVSAHPLKRMSHDEAAEKYIRREELDIDGDGNVEEVKAERDAWIRSIMQAFDAPYNQEPKTKKIPVAEFLRWQKEHHSLTMEKIQEGANNDLAEATATYLYGLVVEGHEKGSLIKSPGTSFNYNLKINCKDRLEKIIEVLERLAIIRYDLVCGARVHELVANPVAVFNRKEENKLENDKKKPAREAMLGRKAEEKAMAEGTAKSDAGLPVKTKAAAKAKNNTSKNGKKTKTDNKRGGKGKAPVTNDDNVSSNDVGEESNEFGSEILGSSARGGSSSVPESEPVKNEDAGADEDDADGSSSSY